MASIRDVVLTARSILTGDAALTALVPAAKITFGNSPQKDAKPRIVIEVARTEYAPTFYDDSKVRTYTVEYAVYSDSVDECTNIMDAVRGAVAANQVEPNPLDFDIRLIDESLQAEVDGVLLGVVSATFQTS